MTPKKKRALWQCYVKGGGDREHEESEESATVGVGVEQTSTSAQNRFDDCLSIYSDSEIVEVNNMMARKNKSRLFIIKSYSFIDKKSNNNIDSHITNDHDVIVNVKNLKNAQAQEIALEKTAEQKRNVFLRRWQSIRRSLGAASKKYMAATNTNALSADFSKNSLSTTSTTTTTTPTMTKMPNILKKHTLTTKPIDEHSNSTDCYIDDKIKTEVAKTTTTTTTTLPYMLSGDIKTIPKAEEVTKTCNR